jgi:hypothetical protein
MHMYDCSNFSVAARRCASMADTDDVVGTAVVAGDGADSADASWCSLLSGCIGPSPVTSHCSEIFKARASATQRAREGSLWPSRQLRTVPSEQPQRRASIEAPPSRAINKRIRMASSCAASAPVAASAHGSRTIRITTDGRSDDGSKRARCAGRSSLPMPALPVPWAWLSRSKRGGWSVPRLGAIVDMDGYSKSRKKQPRLRPMNVSNAFRRGRGNRVACQSFVRETLSER